jgi:hypothetical protein
MALRGTLKDFGIADILQLIGHQGKSGVLTIRNGNQQVDIFFVDGAVVRAESSSRDRRDLLGHMLVRAEVLSEDQVSGALDIQKRTLKRLGQILVETGALDRKVLATFTRLQTTETIYRLFFWSNGTYEFVQKEVQGDPEFEPLKSESILMEGFRQLDEWPSIRRRVTSYSLVFERLKELDPLVPATQMSADDLDLDSAFGGFEGEGSGDPSLRNIGPNERTVYQLIAPERDVQKLVDLSHLGEFETCKALDRLIDAGFIRALPQDRPRLPSAEATIGGISARPSARVAAVLGRAFAIAAAVAGIAVFVRLFDSRWVDQPGAREPWGYTDSSLQSEVALGQIRKIEAALAVFEAMTGSYPAALDELVEARLLTLRDLRFPWRQPYNYRREGGGYALLRPLF